MTEKEYDEKKNLLHKEYEMKLNALNKDYAISNNPYKVGDIIEDHIGKGRIIGFSVVMCYTRYPCMVYKCENLTRGGKVNKREPERKIYQHSIVRL